MQAGSRRDEAVARASEVVVERDLVKGQAGQRTPFDRCHDLSASLANKKRETDLLHVKKDRTDQAGPRFRVPFLHFFYRTFPTRVVKVDRAKNEPRFMIRYPYNAPPLSGVKTNRKRNRRNETKGKRGEKKDRPGC